MVRNETLFRLFEISVSTLAIIVLLPLFALSAFWVFVVDGRPIYFSQERLGVNLSRIRVWKLRTMRLNADVEHEELMRARYESHRDFFLNRENVNRLIPGGRLIRSASIDEYPQLFLVLRGRMALVGPRPMLPSELAYLPEKFKLRFEVKPGVTGLAQVRSRKRLSSAKSMAYDLAYCRKKSFALDLRILFLTPFVMLLGRGH